MWIENKIRELSASFKLSDIAILYRAHYLSRPIEEVFQREKIPYTLNSGVPFFDRAEIKDSLSYLRMIAYKDDLSFLRVVNTPKRNVGERRIKFLQEFVATNGGSLYEALKLNAGDELFANTKAREFIDLIEDFSQKEARNGWTILQNSSSPSTNTKPPAAKNAPWKIILPTPPFIQTQTFSPAKTPCAL